MIRWYICACDVKIEGQTPVREPAILRHLPSSSQGKRAWIEILDNKFLVKSDVSDGRHAEIISDPDFTEITSSADVPVASRSAVGSALEALGYTRQEIQETGFNRDALLRKIASVRCQVRANATRDGIEVVNARIQATTPFEYLSRKVPG